MSLSAHIERKILGLARQAIELNPNLIEQPVLLSSNILSLDQSLRRLKKKVLDQAVDNAINTVYNEYTEANKDEDDLDRFSDNDSSEVDDAALYANKPNSLNRSLQSLYTKNKLESSQALPQTLPSTTSKRKPVPEGPNSHPLTTTDTQLAQTPVKKRKTKTTDAQSNAQQYPTQDPIIQSQTPTSRLTDLGGIDSIIESLMELVMLPLSHPEVYAKLGVPPPRGILLHGPPGCGKTSLATALAGELQVAFFNVSAPSIVSGFSGESEKKIRDLFSEATKAAPSLIFIDEIDAITPKRDSAAREMERRIVAQLLTCMDDLAFDQNEFRPVIVIGATNRQDALDPALRRAGRFDREISMNVPDENARVRILQVLSSKLCLDGQFDFQAIAKLTPGYVGADLMALTGEAGLIAVKRVFKSLNATLPEITNSNQALIDLQNTSSLESMSAMEVDVDVDSKSDSPPALSPANTLIDLQDDLPPKSESTTDSLKSLNVYSHLTIAQFLQAHRQPLSTDELAPLCISQNDFITALAKVQPSSKREGFATVPDVTWDMIGALSRVRDELRMAIVEPVARPELFSKIGIEAPAGVLLWGPPGCGKTLLAKAIANEAHSNFISVKGPELLNKYVGESERAVRQVFARAKSSAPCVIFFDEIDALVPKRDESKSEATTRVINALLTELDGLESRKSVFVIAATNRPDILDPAMLRPGRLDKLLFVELPSGEERYEILRTVARNTPLDPVSVDLKSIALDARCQWFSGADLAALVREASLIALRAHLKGLPGVDVIQSQTELIVCGSHFDLAFATVKPSVSHADRCSYEKLHVSLFGGQ